AERLRLHDHPGPAAVWRVVDRPMPVVREVAEIHDPVLDQPRLRSPPGDAQRERPGEEAGEDRDDVDPHPIPTPHPFLTPSQPPPDAAARSYSSHPRNRFRTPPRPTPHTLAGRARTHSSRSPGGGSITIRFDSTSTRRTIRSTNGIRCVFPGPFTSRRSAGAAS